MLFVENPKIFSSLSQKGNCQYKKPLARTKGYFYIRSRDGVAGGGGVDRLLIFLVENQFNALDLTPILEINSNKNDGNLRRKGRTRRIEK